MRRSLRSGILLGLGTCWICNFYVDKTRELLNLPEHMEPVVILPVGYPLDSTDPERHTHKRKPLSEIDSTSGFAS